jgi:hypothetical protein
MKGRHFDTIEVLNSLTEHDFQDEFKKRRKTQMAAQVPKLMNISLHRSIRRLSRHTHLCGLVTSLLIRGIQMGEIKFWLTNLLLHPSPSKHNSVCVNEICILV